MVSNLDRAYYVGVWENNKLTTIHAHVSGFTPSYRIAVGEIAIRF